ncbi:L,D-transpeptidase family protein [Photobacterium nomapromontoriensis]|uniref:L,D-transpeptidase family protein n=1 Tax=Photobacterium nomapromontoriensis TaxID=2910237 RepID=UPI003D0CBA9C
MFDSRSHARPRHILGLLITLFTVSIADIAFAKVMTDDRVEVSAEPSHMLDLSLVNRVPLASYEQLCDGGEQALCFSEPLKQIYSDNDFMPLWRSPELREALLLRIKTLAYAEIVSGMDERLVELQQLEQQQDLRGFDLLATDTYLVYQALMQQITARPSMLFRHQTLRPIKVSQWETKPDTVISSVVTSGLNELLLRDSLGVNSNELIVIARALRQAELLRQLPAHQYQLVGRKVVRRGQDIPNGQQLLEVLYNYGDLPPEAYNPLTLDPVVNNDGEVNNAIKRFQRRNGLDDDGIIGPATARQLALPYQEVSRVIALNMHRSQFGASGAKRPTIRVNIPDYQLQITHKNNVVFESKVIVGRSTRPTNLFSSALSVMVVNPKWNIPETIKKEDVIPGIQASPDYLERKNLKIIHSWRDRSEILPETIEWSTVDPETFPYEFMQGPGPTNALGNVKFLMPNDYSIYLHDTPARSLFRRTKRNLSSGCVRVEKAAELAEFILKYQRYSSVGSYDNLVAVEDTDTINISRKIDVDFTYVTAWVDENNTLQMREDIYGYDRAIEEPVEDIFSTMKNYRRY